MTRSGERDALGVLDATERTLAHATAHAIYEGSLDGPLPPGVPPFDSPVLLEGIVDFANRRSCFGDPPTIADGGRTFAPTSGAEVRYTVIGNRGAAAALGMPLWLIDVARGVDAASRRRDETVGDEIWTSYECKSSMSRAAELTSGGFMGPRRGLLPVRHLPIGFWIDALGLVRRLATGWQRQRWTLTVGRFDEPEPVRLPAESDLLTPGRT